MRKIIVTVASLMLCSTLALAQTDEVALSDSIEMTEDTVAMVSVDPFVEALDSVAEVQADSIAEEDNDSVYRKPERHPLRKGSYFQIGVGAGISDFTYKVEGGQLGVLPSLTANIGYAYFFVPTVGIGTGAYISQYGAINTLTGEFGKNIPTWNDVTDSDGDTYNHRTRMQYWKERQISYMVEIPLALHFQQNWGHRTGLYAQLGAKFGMPIYSDYKVLSGSMRHVGEYPSLDWNIVGIYETAHGFGYEENKSQTADVKGLPNDSNFQYKYSVGAFFEIGALFQVSKRVDLFLGIYANYGFRNIDPYKGKEKRDIGFRIDDTAEGHGFMDNYNGLIATKQAEGCGINKGINPFSVGVKFGINIFGGRIEESSEPEPELQYIYVHDTIFVTDTLHVTDTITVDYYDTIPAPTVIDEPEVIEQTADTIAEQPTDTLTTDEDSTTANTEEQPKQEITEEQKAVIQQAVTTLEEELSKAVIFFDFDKYDPKLEPADILDKVADVLKAHPDLGIEVNGHACKTGTDEYNQRLSMKRARAVADMLRAKGVKDSQMNVQSFGSTHPFRYNNFAHQKSKDRRVEIIPIGYVDEDEQQQRAAEAQEAATNDEGIVNKSHREIPLVEIDGAMVPIFLKYTEFMGEETVKRGVYLAQLSRKWYNGEQAFWVYIYEANMFQIENPDDIEPGTILMIPKLDPELINPNNPESMRKAEELKNAYMWHN